MEMLSLLWQHCQHIALKQINVMEKKCIERDGWMGGWMAREKEGGREEGKEIF